MRGLFSLFFIFFLSMPVLLWGGAFQDSLSLKKEIRYDESKVSPVDFNQNKIRKLKADPDFDYTQNAQSQSWWESFKNWISNLWSDLWNFLFGDIGADSVLAFIINILPYIILIALVFFAIWLFIKIDPGGSILREPAKPSVNLSLEEEIIQRQDISKLIEKALANKNYRLAVRYNYLLILKNLREQNIIEYQFQKTNTEYLSEIKDVFLREKFRHITRLYDFIWYGDFQVDEAQFNKIKKEFEKILENLQKKKSA